MKKANCMEENIGFTMARGSGYGQYYIYARYKGRDIRACTTNSEAWDWLDDDSDEEKRQEAIQHCYSKIVAEYEKTKECYPV